MADSKHAVLCDTCLHGKKRLSALTLCKECRELYCIKCSSMHAVIPVTREHLLIKISNAKIDSKFNVNLLSPVCSACELTGEGKRQAAYLCDECRDIYCDTCKVHHLRMKATKNHTIYGIPIDADKSTQSLDVRILKKEDIDKVSAEFVTTFNATSKTDKEECWFCGIVSLSQERIVLLDYMNHKIKLFGKDFKLLSEVKLIHIGLGLTRFTDDTVAVLFISHILFYSIQQSSLVKESKSFELKEAPKGISYNGSVFAVSYYEMISVLSNDGDVLHQIKKKFTWNLYVCIDHETNDIYFKDSDNIVNCISTDGKIKWQTKIDGCLGLIAFHNCLLVAAKAKIVLLTRDGKYHRAIFEDKLTEAEHISFDDKTRRLFITQRANGIVTVLQLHY